MDRKHFLSSTAAMAAGSLFSLPLLKTKEDEASIHYKIPPYLKPGDTIGITSPAGFITQEQMLPAIILMQNWGFNIKTGHTIGKRDFTLGGTDQERLEDLQLMLDDPSIKAIMCARGGYGSLRLVDKINWSKFKQRPKWLVGFSDITVLHSHIHSNCHVATIHSKMTNSFPDDWEKADSLQIETILSIQDALTGKKMKYTTAPHSSNKAGTCSGILAGGNLKTLETLAGTPSNLNTDGKILFVEDTGEYLYSIDRMFWNLKRTGKLKKLKGLIIGGFRIKQDDPGEEFGRTLQDIVLEKIREYHYPVCFDFPVGHQRANFALKCGVKHQLMIDSKETILREI